MIDLEDWVRLGLSSTSHQPFCEATPFQRRCVQATGSVSRGEGWWIEMPRISSLDLHILGSGFAPSRARDIATFLRGGAKFSLGELLSGVIQER